MRSRFVGLFCALGLGFTVASHADQAAACVGDCNGNGGVSISELTTAVSIGLGLTPLSSCAAADSGGDGSVQINEIVLASAAAAGSCPDLCAPGIAECSPGQQRSSECSFCGQQQFECDSSCRWQAVSDCTNPGQCEPGTTEQQDCTCGVQTRTCSSQCIWGNFGTCQSQGTCTPNDIQTQECGGHPDNERRATCTNSCSWGPFGRCECPRTLLSFLTCDSSCPSGFYTRNFEGECSAGPPVYKARRCAPMCGDTFEMCGGGLVCPTGYHQQGAAFNKAACSSNVNDPGPAIRCVRN